MKPEIKEVATIALDMELASWILVSAWEVIDGLCVFQ